MIGVAWKHPNVYIDTSAYLPKYYPQVCSVPHPPIPFPLNSAKSRPTPPLNPTSLQPYNLIIPPIYLLTDIQQELIQFANTIGRKKVMFGTNFPQLNWKACVESVHKHTKLREDSKADFFGGNAARVLKLDGVSEKKARL
jgi:uncharacterized protein